MSQRHLAISLTVFGLILGGMIVPAFAQQSCQIGQSVIIAVNSARTGNDVTISSGDVVVNQALSGPTLGDGFSLYIDRKTAITNAIKADRIRIFNQAVISGGATYNQLTNDGTITGGQFTPLRCPCSARCPRSRRRSSAGPSRT